MKPSELKYQHETKHPNSYFFTRDTMRFFGDTMRNFGCYDDGTDWVLYRKKPTRAGLHEWYFDKITFERKFK